MVGSDRGDASEKPPLSHDELEEKRGYGFATFDWLGQKDPAYETIRRKFVGLIYTPESPTLSVKYRELVAAVVLASRFYPSVEVHLRRALSLGLTMQELIEAMEVAAVPGGFPVLAFVLPYLMKIDEELKGGGEPATLAGS